MICCVNLKLQQYCRGAVLHIMLPKVDLILVSSLFVLKMAETDILLSGTIDFILQCAIYCLPDVIIKYVRCKKIPWQHGIFCMGGKSSAPARQML